MSSFMKNVLIVTTLALLAACGGSNKSSVVDPSSSSTISGLAASGAPMAGATIEIAGCSNTATTAGDGTFSVSVTGCGSAPFILKATDPESGNSYLSVAHSVSRTNVTPLSDLVVKQAAGTGNATNIFANAAGIRTNLSSTRVSNVVTQLTSILSAAGLSASGFMTAVFSANSSGIDLVLDMLVITVNGNGTFGMETKESFGGVEIVAANTTALVPTSSSAPSGLITAAEAVADDVEDALEAGDLMADARTAIVDLLGSDDPSEYLGDAATVFGKDEDDLADYDSVTFSGISVVGVCDASVLGSACTVPGVRDTTYQTRGASTAAYRFSGVGTWANGDTVEVRATLALGDNPSVTSNFYVQYDGSAWELIGSSVGYALPELTDEIRDFLAEASDAEAASSALYYDDEDFISGFVSASSGTVSATTDLAADDLAGLDEIAYDFGTSFRVLRAGRIGTGDHAAAAHDLTTSNDHTNSAPFCDFTLTSDNDDAAACATNVGANAVVVEGSVSVTPNYTDADTVSGEDPVVTGAVRILLYKNLPVTDGVPAWKIRSIYKMGTGSDSRRVIID